MLPISTHQLLNAAVPDVARWCARLGGPWVNAEDAAQDVLATATRRITSLQNPAHFDAWLFGITRRVLAAHRRRVWLRRWVPGAPPTVADSAHSPETNTIMHQRAKQLTMWLEQLPTKQREAVVLCTLEERTNGEAASILQIPLGTLKSRLRLGLKALRTLAKDTT